MDALDRIAAATRSIKHMDGGGVLSMSVLSTFAMRWLVPRLPRFQQQHPDILVDITTSERLVTGEAFKRFLTHIACGRRLSSY